MQAADVDEEYHSASDRSESHASVESVPGNRDQVLDTALIETGRAYSEEDVLGNEEASDVGLTSYEDDVMHSSISPSELSDPNEVLDEIGDNEVNDDFTFDRSVAAQHTYLGEVSDLEGGGAVLDENKLYTLPLLPLEGLVVVPGDTLPLKLLHRADRIRIHRALTAPPPLTRLLAVVCAHRFFGSQVSISRVGCTVEIKQIRTDGNGTINCIAKGRQRMEVQPNSTIFQGELSRADVLIVLDPVPDRVPLEVRQGRTWWAPWAYRPFDAYALAEQAKTLLKNIAPNVKEFKGDPLSLSYWLISNLPLEDTTRQRLLEARTAAKRLGMEIQLMQQMSKLNCRYCRSEIATTKDIILMTDNSVSSVFVNTHGYMHDMVTVRRTKNIQLEGGPTTANSWFPGYAWTIAYCRLCRQHLGWKFTAAQCDLTPEAFWGLRRDVLSQLPIVQASFNEEEP